MSQNSVSCDLKLAHTPTIFTVGKQQSIAIYSPCKGIARWEVADTDDWKSDEGRQTDGGEYFYRLRARWHQAVTNEEGIRFHFQPLPAEEREPETISLAVIVEDSRYPRLARAGAAQGRLLALRALTFALWVATALLGIWALTEFVQDIWPAILVALTPQMLPDERRRLFNFSWNLWVLLLSIVWLAVIMLEAEYLRKRVGQPGAWRLLGVILAVEIAILVLAQLV